MSSSYINLPSRKRDAGTGSQTGQWISGTVEQAQADCPFCRFFTCYVLIFRVSGNVRQNFRKCLHTLGFCKHQQLLQKVFKNQPLRSKHKAVNTGRTRPAITALNIHPATPTHVIHSIVYFLFFIVNNDTLTHKFVLFDCTCGAKVDRSDPTKVSDGRITQVSKNGSFIEI